ncbi:unnamed protein product [Penicillium salamii]|nr:unnamed protein product [Penicillium salamii]
MKLAISQRLESYKFLRKWTALLYNRAWYTQKIGHIMESQDIASESRNQRLSMFGLNYE